MNVLIFGATGFIGKNLVDYYARENTVDVAKLSDDEESLTQKVSVADVIINASGVSRSNAETDFFLYNFYYSQKLFQIVNKFEGKMYVYFSSIHFYVETIYGLSKRYNEFLLNNLSFQNKNYFLCLRIPSIFGPGMKPNYVSVVATFCHNIANGKESSIIDGEKILQLLYVDDLIRDIDQKVQTRKPNGFELYDVFKRLVKISVNHLYKSIEDTANKTGGVSNENNFAKNIEKTYNFFVENRENQNF